MIIDGSSCQTIEKGLCNILEIDIETLHDTIGLFEMKSTKGQCFYSDIYKQECYKFIDENKRKQLEEIYVYHLGRYIAIPNELKPLPKLLTSKNSLTEYLKSRDVFFTYEDRKIWLVYKGKRVNAVEIYDEQRLENHCRLAKRFGYFNIADFCVNGFAFAADIEKEGNHYYSSLQIGPELLQDLDDFLETDMCNDFNKISHYYLFTIKASLDDIIFDGKEDVRNHDEKQKYYLYKCMLFLNEAYERSSSRDNPIIRFRDDKTVKIEEYVQFD